MVRIAVSYLAIAVVGILLVTGLPFGLFSGKPQEVALTQPVAEPEVAPLQVPGVVAAATPEAAPLPEALPEVEVELAEAPEADAGMFAEVTAWLSVSEPEAPVVEQTAQTSALPLTTDGSIADTTAMILKELSAPLPQVDAQNTVPTAMSDDAVATLLAAKGADDLGIEVTLERLLASAMSAGQRGDQIDRLINEAASQGSVRVPASMVTTSGRVDTMVLMASMVALTKVETTEQGDSSSTDSYVTPETAILDIEDMVYIVQEGDSLGGLALRFYGNPQLFQPIFEANRTVLATPSSIRAGQQLLIPSRAKL